MIRSITSFVLALSASVFGGIVDTSDPSYRYQPRPIGFIDNTAGTEPIFVHFDMPTLVFDDAQDTLWEMSIYYTFTPPLDLDNDGEEDRLLPSSQRWWTFWSNGAQYPDWQGGAVSHLYSADIDPDDDGWAPDAFAWRAHKHYWQPDVGALLVHLEFVIPPGYAFNGAAKLDSQETHAPELSNLALMSVGSLFLLRKR